jgi:hypothetical protein
MAPNTTSWGWWRQVNTPILENTLIVLFPLRLPSVELRTLPNSGVNASLKRE